MGRVNPPFGSLFREEEDDGNSESPSGQTRLDEPSAGQVSFLGRLFSCERAVKERGESRASHVRQSPLDRIHRGDSRP